MNEIKRLLRAGSYALDGLGYLLKKEKNTRLLLGIALLALIICTLLGFSVFQTMFVFFTVMMTLVTEVLNTAIEVTLDLQVQGRYHPKVKIAKDAASCAVLFCVITSTATFFVFLFSNLLKVNQ
ncbi:diacylglycerol kinase [Phosphitispora sp. TUW77]|uniref:diacylglycerol kinase n=1 Tax=Phosphitispora sp. TUW77 TaxID=3152361 RepID=UPI003AB3FE35